MALVLLEGFEDLTSWVTTGSSTLSSANGRNGLGVNITGGGNNVTYSIPTALQSASLTFGCAFKPTAQGTTAALFSFLSDAAATTHVTISTNSNGSLEVRRGNTLGTILGATPTSLTVIGQWYYLELQIVLSDTVGSILLRLNGTTQLTLTNQDTKNAGTKTVFDSLFMSGGSSTGASYDDLYLTNSIDTFWGDTAVETLYPDGMDTTAWVGSDGDALSNHLLVNEPGTPVDTTYTQSSTVAAREVYTLQNLQRANGPVLGVQVNARANKSDSGARGLKVVAKGTTGTPQSTYTSQTPTSSTQWTRTFGHSFTIADSGNIIGLRFYRDPSTIPTSRTLRLWTDAGVALASVATTGDTGGGWKTGILTTPVAVTAGTTVRVSEDLDVVQHYVYSTSLVSLTNGFLTRNTPGYSTATIGGFPSTPETAPAMEYFVDLVFVPTTSTIQSSADNALTTTFTDYSLPLEKKNDASAWTVADVNALGIGVEVGS